MAAGAGSRLWQASAAVGAGRLCSDRRAMGVGAPGGTHYWRRGEGWAIRNSGLPHGKLCCFGEGATQLTRPAWDWLYDAIHSHPSRRREWSLVLKPRPRRTPTQPPEAIRGGLFVAGLPRLLQTRSEVNTRHQGVLHFSCRRGPDSSGDLCVDGQFAVCEFRGTISFTETLSVVLIMSPNVGCGRRLSLVERHNAIHQHSNLRSSPSTPTDAEPARKRNCLGGPGIREAARSTQERCGGVPLPSHDIKYNLSGARISEVRSMYMAIPEESGTHKITHHLEESVSRAGGCVHFLRGAMHEEWCAARAVSAIAVQLGWSKPERETGTPSPWPAGTLPIEAVAHVSGILDPL